MAGIGDSDIDGIGSRQGIGLLVAGTEDMTSDAIEVPLFANVVKLLEVEQRRDVIYLQRIELEKQANDAISDLFKDIFHCWGHAVVRTILSCMTVPWAIAFAFSILFMCLFVADVFNVMANVKWFVTSMNISIKFQAERHKKVRADARILMELEKIRKRKVAGSVVDMGEGPVMNMYSFITRTKTIYDAADFPDFKRVYYRKINSSWLLVAVLVLVMTCFAYKAGVHGAYTVFY